MQKQNKILNNKNENMPIHSTSFKTCKELVFKKYHNLMDVHYIIITNIFLWSFY